MSRPKPRRVLICTSPNAGDGSGREQLPELRRLLAERGIDSMITDSIPQLENELASPQMDTVVVAAGGDGTIALVADHTPADVPIVPLPLGTENLLSKHFAYSPLAADALKTVVSGTDRAIDAGRANGKLFLVMVSAGFDAEVVRAVHLRRRGHIRKWHYAQPILRALRRYQFPEIEVSGFGETSGEGETYSARWAFAFNLPRYGGGLKIEPDANGSDGRLNLVTLLRGSIRSAFAYWFAILLGRLSPRDDVNRHSLTGLTLRSRQRVPYQVDGDYAGRLPVEIAIEPSRVLLRLPPPSDT